MRKKNNWFMLFSQIFVTLAILSNMSFSNLSVRSLLLFIGLGVIYAILSLKDGK